MRLPASVMSGFCALACLATVSCQSMARPEKCSPQATTAALVDLHGGGESVPIRNEAGKIARLAHREAQRLAARYRVGTVSWLHNCLVNTGVRDRGLCWHYMEDLHAALSALGLEFHDLHFGVRDSGRLFHEHHCVVVTARGARFETGIVLDPWKKPGKLLHFPVRGHGRPWVEDVRYAEYRLMPEGRSGTRR